MLGEIDKYYFCSAGFYRKNERSDCLLSRDGCQFYRDKCGCYHRKYPTPEQYKEEYGEEYPFDGAVYGFYADFGWLAGTLKGARLHQHYKITGGFGFCESIVCAATPFGKPDPDWRPE